MKPLGRVKTFEPIADLTAMPTFVECVNELPDPKTVPVNTVFRLINSQKKYVAMHFYVCNEYEPGLFEWMDLTNDDTIVEASSAIATMTAVRNTNSVLVSYKLTATNFPTSHDSVVDEFKKDVCVGKLGEYPECVEDGVELLSSTDVNGIVNYPIAVSKIGEPTGCFYRVFRIFQSGYTFYKDVTVS